MNFIDLTDLLETPREDYYELLLDNAELILREVAMTSKHEVAEKLGLKASAFSIAIKFIIAQANREAQ